MLLWLRRVAAVFTLGLLAACGGDDDSHTPTVLQTAAADARFSTLVEAVQAAGLTDTLAGPGPFTVFAPTNDAFAALLAELGVTKAQLFADTALLRTVLTYHVISGDIRAAQVPLGKAVTTVQGGIFKVDAVGSGLVVTDGRNRTSNIVITDLAASNGVIHVVDRVLLPADKTVLQTAQSLPQFSLLVEAVQAAGLEETLSGAGPFTVFAPTNDAFVALLAELNTTKDALFADTALLTRVLTYHVLAARALKADVPVGTAITTVEGGTFTVDATLTITDANARTSAIVATDVLASNGVIHVIDTVLLP